MKPHGQGRWQPSGDVIGVWESLASTSKSFQSVPDVGSHVTMASSCGTRGAKSSDCLPSLLIQMWPTRN